MYVILHEFHLNFRKTKTVNTPAYLMSRQPSHSPGFLLDPPSLLTLDVAPGSTANHPPSTLAHFWAAASSLNHTPPLPPPTPPPWAQSPCLIPQSTAKNRQ